MAKIGNDRMIVRAECRDDNSWLFLVCYTACFDEAELGRRFDDRVLVRPVHSVGQSGFCYESPVAFTACSPRVFRRKRIVVREDLYDPDAGLDTVSAWIQLHDADTDAVDDEQCTPPVVPLNGARQHAPARRPGPRGRVALLRIIGPTPTVAKLPESPTIRIRREPLGAEGGDSFGFHRLGEPEIECPHRRTRTVPRAELEGCLPAADRPAQQYQEAAAVSVIGDGPDPLHRTGIRSADEDDRVILERGGGPRRGGSRRTRSTGMPASVTGDRMPKSRVPRTGSHATPSMLRPPSSASRSAAAASSGCCCTTQSRNPGMSSAVRSPSGVYRTRTSPSWADGLVPDRQRRRHDKGDLAVDVDPGQALRVGQRSGDRPGQRASPDGFPLRAIGIEDQFEQCRGVPIVREHEAVRAHLHHARGVELRLAVPLGERDRRNAACLHEQKCCPTTWPSR